MFFKLTITDGEKFKTRGIYKIIRINPWLIKAWQTRVRLNWRHGKLEKSRSRVFMIHEHFLLEFFREHFFQDNFGFESFEGIHVVRKLSWKDQSLKV